MLAKCLLYLGFKDNLLMRIHLLTDAMALVVAGLLRAPPTSWIAPRSLMRVAAGRPLSAANRFLPLGLVQPTTDFWG